MHVGVFAEEYKPHYGGGYTFVNDVINAFLAKAAESRHRYSLFCAPDTAAPIRQRALPGNVAIVPIRRRGAVGRALATLKHAWPAFGFIWQQPCALERHARAHGVEIMWYVGGFHDTLDMPFIATVWDVQHLTHPWFPEVSARWRWEYRQLFLERHLRRASCIITGTEVGRDELVFFYRIPRERIHVLPHPVPKFALDAGISSDSMVTGRFGLNPGYLLYPAQYWAHKNHVNLLLALKHLRDTGYPVPDLALAGSGRGNLAYVRMKAAEMNLADKVHFLGFVTTDELIALYRHAGALVYPSFSGPENLPPLEAFALGCPVAISDYPGAREQLGDAALFFDPLEPRTIADAILGLQEPATRNRLIEAGRARACRWSGDDYVRGVFGILDGFEGIRRAWAAP